IQPDLGTVFTSDDAEAVMFDFVQPQGPGRRTLGFGEQALTPRQDNITEVANGKDYLLLKRASASRPSGEWNDDDYDVLADGVVVGRIFFANAAPGSECRGRCSWSTTRIARRHTAMPRHARLRWRHSRKAGGGSGQNSTNNSMNIEAERQAIEHLFVGV